MGMGGIWELLDGKIWEWDLSFRWEWEWDGNGNEVIEMGGICYEKSIPAHLYLALNLLLLITGYCARLGIPILTHEQCCLIPQMDQLKHVNG